MKRIPSLVELTESARAAFLRFPETVITGLLCSLVGLTAVTSDMSNGGHRFELLSTLSLGISLTFAIAAAAETGVLSSFARRIAGLFVALFLGGFYAASFVVSSELFAIHLALVSLASHLLVAFLPYFRRGTDDAFWEFNQELLARFLQSAVYSGVLFVGLAIAMGTVQYLFSLRIPSEAYVRLWVCVAFAFNTWIFCGSIQHPLPQGEVTSYPKPLRVLTQYILVPLVTLYLLILYGYLVRIALQRAWPQGTVGYLVSGFSVLGMLALLFVHPIREASESRWVRVYARRFYFSLLPLVALLILATWRRVSEYGITEKRYLLLALGLWIAGVALYFLQWPRGSIRVIPISLCAVAVLSSFGPWSASSVSRADQIARVRGILERHGLLIGRKVHAASSPVDFATRKSISAALDYLNRIHRGAGINSWFDREVLQQPGETRPSNNGLSTGRMMTAMGLVYVSQWQSQGFESFQLYAERGAGGDSLHAIVLSDDQVMIPVNLYRFTGNPAVKVVFIEGRRFEVNLDAAGILRVHDGEVSVDVPIAPLAWRLRSQNATPSQTLPVADMTVDAVGDGLEAKLVLWGLNGRVQNPDSTGASNAPDAVPIEIQQLEGALFLRLR